MPALNELFEQHGLHARHESGGEWSSPCPACGGNDRCRIWPEKNEGRGRFWCRQCGAQGDGIVRNAREHQSPHYTTAWSDIPGVKVE